MFTTIKEFNLNKKGLYYKQKWNVEMLAKKLRFDCRGFHKPLKQTLNSHSSIVARRLMVAPLDQQICFHAIRVIYFGIEYY